VPVGDLIKVSESKLTAAHYASLNDATVVRVSGKSKLRVAATEGLGGSSVHARHLVLIVEPNSDLESMIDAREFSSDAVETLFIEMIVQENSNVKLFFYAEPPTKSPSLFVFKRILGKNSSLRYCYLSTGGLMHHQREETIILEGSEVLTGGSCVALPGERIDYYASVIHDGPKGFSRARAQGISLAGGFTVTRGMARVTRKGEWSNTIFEAGVMLLGKDAKGYSAPMLQIETGNVVEATHEALGSKPDDDMVFYLQTRGLSKGEAWKIMVYGILDKQLEYLEEGWLREKAEELLVRILDEKVGSLEHLEARHVTRV
jgi:Fe-S cluster assembly scaffold protein SufB